MKQTKTARYSLNSDPVTTSNICNNPQLQKLKSAYCLQDCLAIDNAAVCFNCNKTHRGHNFDYLMPCNICNYFSSHGDSMKKVKNQLVVLLLLAII